MFGKIKVIEKLLVGVIDLLVIHMGILATFFIKFGAKIPEENWNAYKGTFLWISIAFISVFIIYDMYDLYNKKMEDYVASICVALVFLQLLIITLTFFARQFAFPRTVLIGSYFVNLIFMLIWRFIVYRRYIKSYGKKVVMIVGEYDESEKLIKKMIDEYKQWHEVRYIISPTKLEEIKNYIDEVEVVYFMENISDRRQIILIKECLRKDKKVFILPKLRDLLIANCSVNNIDDAIILNITKFDLNFEERLVKRIVDIVLSLIGIIISSPIMLICAIVIKITSKGPILYKQTRVTRGLKSFKIYKFRTMKVDAEKESGPMLSTEGDTRITAVGNFLRRVRLDELPQLFNVLKGDMSIVGPRPERPFFTKQFIQENEEYLLRFRVKAGITGLAQVKGRYNTDVWDKLKMDLVYIKNYSLIGDIKIMFLTIRTLLMKSATEGVNEEKDLHELISSMNYTVREELGMTILEEQN